MLDGIVIGAGAAGLAAARLLHDEGRSVLIIEARDRIGGRIWTDHRFAGFPVELGAEFIHGDGAVTHALLAQANLTPLPVVRLDNLWWAENGQIARPRDRLSPAIRQKLDTLLARYATLSVIPLTNDLSLAAFLAQDDDPDLDMADVLLAQTCCAPIDRLSTQDLQREMCVDSAGDGEARIGEGYDALLAWLSRGLSIEMSTKVDLIEWGPDRVIVRCGDRVFQGRSCIVTAPVSVLQRQSIHFDPPLSVRKREAITSFRIEPATKLIYRFTHRLWDASVTYIAHKGLAARWWTPGFGRDDAAVMCAFLTAERASKIDALPEKQALSIGLAELSQLIDVSLETLVASCEAMKRVSWAHDPFAHGGYAYVPVGKADCREILAEPEGKTLFFAGEAAAFFTNPQTVHGAIESGWRAARTCLESLS